MLDSAGPLRQHGAESGSELAEVKPINDTVAVVIEIAQIVAIPDLRTKGASEEAQIKAIDCSVAIHVAEKPEEVRRAIAAGLPVAVAIQQLTGQIRDLRAENG